MTLNSNTEATAVKFDNVTVRMGGNTILDGVSARIPAGSSTAIVGPNGAGKTTMLLSLLGQVPFEGSIEIENTPEGKKPCIGYVPQRLSFDRGMPVTVLEFMVMGWQRMPLWFGIRKSHREKALAHLRSVKIEGVAERKLGALSGGEMQRVLLALALGQEPDLLVLDEPAAGVDFQGEYIFCELLEDLRRKNGFTQLMVSHDLATVTHHATHVICLNRKVAAEGKPREVLTHDTLAAIFGLHMGLVDSRVLPKCDGSCKAHCCNGEHKYD
ncbi:MAG: metal ABC transporter ATP-binding protein [Planctomycetes bacterium]|nr:metal ABC transporter ATP-binding protein [Planctomycetota bacterium]